MTINGLNISDNISYITEEIGFRSAPKRDVQQQPLSRRPGSKLTATEWSEKEITVKGYVFGTNAGTLRTNVDTLQQNFAVQSLALQVDSDRQYTATLTKLDIPNQFYNLTMVPYTATFLAVDPFAYGTPLTVSGTTTSGTGTLNGTLTISGSVFAEPTLTINPIGAPAGDSGIKALKITHVPTGESLTISGMMNYTADIAINYANYSITNSGVTNDYTGVFSRFDPGTLNFTIVTSSGVSNGYNWKWTYQPRFLQ